MPIEIKTIYVVIQNYTSPEKAFWSKADAQAYAEEAYKSGLGLVTYEVWEVEIDATRN